MPLLILSLMQIIKFFCFTVIFLSQSIAAANIDHYFNSIKSDPNALYAFLKAMPKGGELHYHLAGGAYPETMISVANPENYCLEKANVVIQKSQKPCQNLRLGELLNQPELYHETIQAWSMKNFIPGDESGHDHFFASFNKFMPLVADYRPQLLAQVMQRAANQNEQYLEIMILPDNAHSTTFGKIAARHQSIEEKRKALLADADFQDNIKNTINESAYILKKAHEELNCSKNPTLSVCNITVKFQYYLLREQPLDNLFAQALNGFEAASNSSVIVGINLVQAEDDPISLRDYHQQMLLLNELHSLYSDVHIALHAGELAPESAVPKALRFHIRDAIFTGHAERIGHGVSIAYENDASDLVRYMASKPIPVEINLTSNRKILNIYGKSHPLNFYLANQVPVVLSTDDEGVLRTDLTREYVTAATDHNLDYSTLKNISRNALTYSFLPGKSLWQNAATATPVKACSVLESATCHSFIKHNEKAKLQWRLENKLVAFEKHITLKKKSKSQRQSPVKFES